MSNQKGIKCEECKEIFYYNDEITFLLGDTVVFVDEQYPDWDKSLCNECAEKKNLI